jgi:hypothetical protein
MTTRVLKPFPPRGPWCSIFNTHGHDPYQCPMKQKYKTLPKSSYCNFFKLVGHDDKYCRNMELMRERTSDTYRVQLEMMIGQYENQYSKVQQPYKNEKHQYNNTQPQYNNAQP